MTKTTIYSTMKVICAFLVAVCAVYCMWFIVRSKSLASTSADTSVRAVQKTNHTDKSTKATIVRHIDESNKIEPLTLVQLRDNVRTVDHDYYEDTGSEQSSVTEHKHTVTLDVLTFDIKGDLAVRLSTGIGGAGISISDYKRLQEQATSLNLYVVVYDDGTGFFATEQDVADLAASFNTDFDLLKPDGTYTYTPTPISDRVSEGMPDEPPMIDREVAAVIAP